jgi:hypothetical protein
MTVKRGQRESVTHGLSSAARGSRGGRELRPSNEGHMLSVEGRAKQSSEGRSKTSERGALTSCLGQSEGVVRRAESEIKQGKEEHSHPVECNKGYSRPVRGRARVSLRW